MGYFAAQRPLVLAAYRLGSLVNDTGPVSEDVEWTMRVSVWQSMCTMKCSGWHTGHTATNDVTSHSTLLLPQVRRVVVMSPVVTAHISTTEVLPIEHSTLQAGSRDMYAMS